MPAVAAQLASYVGGALAVGDVPEDQEDLRGAAMRPLQGGAGPVVEVAAAAATLVVQHGVTVSVVNAKMVPLTAAGAGQPFEVEQLHEFAVAGTFVYLVVQGEIHQCAGMRRAASLPKQTTPVAVGKRPRTKLAS